MTSSIDFWFSIGSTYTYLSVMRLEAVERQSGVRFRWCPFDIRATMIELGYVPPTKPFKARYMWRDIERRAKMYGLPWSGIPPYPIKHLSVVNRIALVGATEGWCAQYAKAAYQRWFINGHDPTIEPDVSTALKDIGQNPDRVLLLAASDEMKAAIQSQLDEARALELFGSPTFVSGMEIFWGDDRLEDAIRWHRQSERQATTSS
jgi:2-hydroxychromene-2-carboxylate isomerase